MVLGNRNVSSFHFLLEGRKKSWGLGVVYGGVVDKHTEISVITTDG